MGKSAEKNVQSLPAIKKSQIPVSPASKAESPRPKQRRPGKNCSLIPSQPRQYTLSGKFLSGLVKIDVEAAKDKPDPEKLKKPRPAAHILVIDDEEVIRNLLTDVLTDAGYEVMAVAGAEEALEKLKKAPFEVVITDLLMPGMDGIEVLRKVRKIDSDIPVIVITGYATVETAVKAMKGGAYDYISKPFNPAGIKIAVGRAIERRVLLKGVREKDYYREQSLTDGLTRLYNHRHFHELLERVITRARRYPQHFSLLMLDIDDFKKYNDAHGHLAGDELLRKIAAVLSREAREADLVARYGGEEFGIILPETDKEGAYFLARRLKKIIEETKFEKEEVMPRGCLTMSIGVATYPEDAQSREELIRKADEALYEAKHLGKNRVCFFNKGGDGGKGKT